MFLYKIKYLFLIHNIILMFIKRYLFLFISIIFLITNAKSQEASGIRLGC